MVCVCFSELQGKESRKMHSEREAKKITESLNKATRLTNAHHLLLFLLLWSCIMLDVNLFSSATN